MTRSLRTWLAAATLALAAPALLAPLTAHADGTSSARRDDDDKKKKGGKKKKPPEGKKGKKGKKGGKDKDPGVGPFDKDKYPMQERLRPLVLPDGMGEVTAGAGFQRFAGINIVPISADFSYGLGDSFELGATTGILVSPDFDWSGLALHGHGLAYDSEFVDFAPGLVLGADGGFDVFSGAVDLTTRAVASEQVFFRFGQGAIPFAIAGGDLVLGLAANGGLGWQIDKPIVVFVDTQLFNVALAPDTAFSGPWETLWLSGGLQYTADRNVDIGGALTLQNTWDVDDSLFAGVNVYGRFRF